VKHLIGNVADIPPGEKRQYHIKNIPIVVVHSADGRFHAIYDRCPHQGVELCKGALSGETEAAGPGAPFVYRRDGEILRCPWHGFGFDVTTGACVNAPEFRVRTYALSVEQSQLYLEL
jgi:3-phenylpropionate/trans-cinnamate dioxygenase ferredoxin subunit